MESQPLTNPIKVKRRLTPFSSNSNSFTNPFENSSHHLKLELLKTKSTHSFKRKSKHTFDNLFMIIGVESEGLELIEEDDFVLNPKIIFNYPNNIKESELS